MAKGQQRSSKEPKKLKTAEAKPKGPRYLQPAELLAPGKSVFPRPPGKR